MSLLLEALRRSADRSAEAQGPPTAPVGEAPGDGTPAHDAATDGAATHGARPAAAVRRTVVEPQAAPALTLEPLEAPAQQAPDDAGTRVDDGLAHATAPVEPQEQGPAVAAATLPEDLPSLGELPAAAAPAPSTPPPVPSAQDTEGAVAAAAAGSGAPPQTPPVARPLPPAQAAHAAPRPGGAREAAQAMVGASRPGVGAQGAPSRGRRQAVGLLAGVALAVLGWLAWQLWQAQQPRSVVAPGLALGEPPASQAPQDGHSAPPALQDGTGEGAGTWAGQPVGPEPGQAVAMPAPAPATPPTADPTAAPAADPGGVVPDTAPVPTSTPAPAPAPVAAVTAAAPAFPPAPAPAPARATFPVSAPAPAPAPNTPTAAAAAQHVRSAPRAAEQAAPAPASSPHAHAASPAAADGPAAAARPQRVDVTRSQALAQLQEAWAALQRGDAPRAQQLYQQVQAERPQDPDAALGLAVALHRQARHDEAWKAYQHSLELWPGNDTARVGALALLAQSDPASAESRLREWIERQPRDAAAQGALGQLLGRQGRWPEALAPLTQAQQLAPGGAAQAYNLAVALDQLQRPQEAVRLYRQALQLGAAGVPVQTTQRRISELQELLWAQ